MSGLFRWLRKQRIKATSLAAALLAGLLLHLSAVLATSHLAVNPAIAALASFGAVNQMAVVPVYIEGHPQPAFLSPGERYAVCRFDLRNGPVDLRATLGSDDWVLAIYSPSGANVFALSGADLDRRGVELLLAVEGAAKGPPLPIAHDSGLVTAVGLTNRTGLAVITAPAVRLADAALADKLLGQASCKQRPVSTLSGAG